MRLSPEPLKIAIDARGLLKQRTGVERMLFHFVDSLSKVAPQCQFLLFIDAEPPAELRQRWVHEFVVVPRGQGSRLQGVFDVWLAFRLRRELVARKVHAFFSPHTKFPFAPLPRLITVHGLEWAFYPEGYKLTERLKQWFWFTLSCWCAQGIVTFADHTLEDIRKLKPRCRLPVCVVPEGVDGRFQRRAAPDAGCLKRVGIERPFILSVCSLEPRKNIDTLIRAYARATCNMADPPLLVLVGRSAWKADRLRAIADSEGVSQRVIFAGYVPDDDLVILYSSAVLFVYPSRYEGFGLPVLEAMACGVPVITSRTSALGEVGGDAAVLIDPASPGDLAAAIRKLLSDADLRTHLRARGLERVRRFSWDTMGRRICEFIAQQALQFTPAEKAPSPRLKSAARARSAGGVT